MDQTGSSSTNGIACRPAVRLVLLTVGIIVWLLVAWLGRVIVMLLFASVVFAVLLSAVVDWVDNEIEDSATVSIRSACSAQVSLSCFLRFGFEVHASLNNLPTFRPIFLRRAISFWNV